MGHGLRRAGRGLLHDGVGRERRRGLTRHLAALTSAAVLAGVAIMVAPAVGASAPASGRAVGALSITNFPRRAVAPFFGVRNTWAASNWSGYAETGRFTGVTGTWTVPSVAATNTPTYSSAWIGVDGFNDADLIQTGTEQDYYGGAAHYVAWWEILPSSETQLSPSLYPVAPGDRMSGSIYETSASVSSRAGFFGHRSSQHVWVVSVADTTRGWSFSTNQSYNGPGSSAEWVIEAPEVGGSVATLAQYTVSPPANTGDFDNAGTLATVVSGGTPTFSAAGLNYQNNSGVMIQNNVQVSTPGDPDAALTAFDTAYGPALPPTPAG